MTPHPVEFDMYYSGNRFASGKRGTWKIRSFVRGSAGSEMLPSHDERGGGLAFAAF
jgi:hypothetical protein